MPTSLEYRTPPTQTTLITATGNGNYTLPPGCVGLRFQGLAGGIGAGSGRQGAAGSVRCAGGPGGNGAFVDLFIPAADLLAAFPTGVIPYNVGPGTAGGAAAAAPDTNGNAGTAPVTATNATWLGSNAGPTCFAIARPGAAGAGGTNAAGAAGGKQDGTAPTPSAGNASATGLSGTVGPFGTSGPGGGITAADVAGAGAAGSAGLFSGASAGTGGVVGGAAPTSGSAAAGRGPGGPPGGGAASITGAAQAGADAVANSGCGGGGGGASLNGNNSGKGGDGGSGFLRLTAEF